ncbi:MAG: hypothetical protein LBR08_03590 [Bacteroidales bacterium]|nr:hypothetical protein [Bacteroidales bacterium]
MRDTACRVSTAAKAFVLPGSPARDDTLLTGCFSYGQDGIHTLPSPARHETTFDEGNSASKKI